MDQELAKEYINDLKPLKAILKHLKARRDIYLKLVTECEENQEWELAADFESDYQDYKLRASQISSIISSSEFSIRWLKTGQEPKSYSGESKLPYEKRTVSVSDVDQALIFMNQFKYQYNQLSEDDLAKVNDYLARLTPQEKAVYISIKGQGNSYKQTAIYLKVSKTTVQEYLKRGEAKVKENLKIGVQTTLF
ncbi:sigma factor-like helix-turn-helix DNA-binding protein [Enterococcus sp. HY326]|uniref:sigma factor-like helix-turn-helix DNA-binding protein n=1 Tax=Enterococcus sp. HY326 TaxID=2971265 RepID=UPI00223FB892|nr:sigma factor-like helix-turn-helix DNA-binding protein [Enterococcus sp. HY326]